MNFYAVCYMSTIDPRRFRTRSVRNRTW